MQVGLTGVSSNTWWHPILRSLLLITWSLCVSLLVRLRASCAVHPHHIWLHLHCSHRPALVLLIIHHAYHVIGVIQALTGSATHGASAAEDDRVAARRQRGALRLLPELLAAGILSDPSGFLTVIKSLVGAEAQ